MAKKLRISRKFFNLVSLDGAAQAGADSGQSLSDNPAETIIPPPTNVQPPSSGGGAEASDLATDIPGSEVLNPSGGNVTATNVVDMSNLKISDVFKNEVKTPDVNVNPIVIDPMLPSGGSGGGGSSAPKPGAATAKKESILKKYWYIWVAVGIAVVYLGYKYFVKKK